jgi:16S rRNA (cytosine1402-N4)-methyltransferase
MRSVQKHFSVMLSEVLDFFPSNLGAELQNPICGLDVTAGGGGHLEALMRVGPGWAFEAWDQDYEAEGRVRSRVQGLSNPFVFRLKNFREAPTQHQNFGFILADLGVSSFQLDDNERGLSLHSVVAPDFRLQKQGDFDLERWIKTQSVLELETVLREYGEEPRAEKLARALKNAPGSVFQTTLALSDWIRQTLAYKTMSRIHPATRSLQALRIAINDEMGALRDFLDWAPSHLVPGGRLVVISFHSLEDRLVKEAFRKCASQEESRYEILTKKPLTPGPGELRANPRSRSAKLRVVERIE